MTSFNEGMLTDALVLAQQQLQSFAQGENFWSVFDSIFGTEYDRTQAEVIQQAWQANDFSQLPEIQVLDSASMPGIQGGFSAETGKIYINAEFLANATTDQIAAVLLEEIGHSIDSQVNAIDTPGDEGELFSNLLRGIVFTNAELLTLQTENDSKVITTDTGDLLTVEASTTAHTIFFDTFANNNAGWILGPEWQISAAKPFSGQTTGNGDPSTDYTPTADNGIAGVVIGGNASTANLHNYYYLTSPVINTSGSGSRFLEFYRWLNSDYTPYMQNTIDVYNGSTWVNIWSTGSPPPVFDNAWTQQLFNITPYKSNNTQVRFGFNIGSSGVWSVSSWNIDDFKIFGINNAPILTGAKALLANGMEDLTYTIAAASLLIGFSDVDGDSLSISNLSASNGTLVSNNNGTWNFTPTTNYNGTVNLSYNVIDGYGNSVAATQSFNLAPVNDAPTGSATAILATGTEDTPYIITASELLQGFSDVDGDTLSITNLTATNGSLVNNNNDTYTFTPNANFNGTVGLAYTVVDSKGGSVAANRTVAIANTNDAPVVSNAIADQSATEDDTLSFTIPTNTFSDVDGDTLTYSATRADGSVLPSWLNFDAITRTFSGTPENDDVGSLDVKVITRDGSGATAEDIFTLAIANTNDAPTLTGTSATLVNGIEDITYTINAAELLQGFSDVDTGDILFVSDLTATNGNLVDNNDGTYSFTPAANFNGTVNLAYDVVDGNGGNIAATQSFTVDAINDVPVGTASGDLLNGTEDTAYTINAADLLQGFGDVDGDILSVSDLTATNGNLVNNNDGTYSFAPAANFNGTVNLSYDVIDSNGGSVAATQSFTLDAANDVPTGTASANLINGTEDTSYTINAVDLLKGFSDLDGDTLAVSDLVATDGTLINNNDGTYSFTPAANYNGTVNLSYNVVDGNGGAIAAAQSITIAAVNDAPVVSNAIAAQNTLEDSPFTFTIPANTFSDVDGDTLIYTATLATGEVLPTWLSFDGTTLSGTPTNDEVGNLNIQVTASDGELSVSNLFNLAIANTNDAPTATNDSLITSEDTPLVISAATLLGNDVDVDLGDILSVSEFTQPSQGGLVDNGNGTYTYSPNANYNGGDSFAYTIRDRDGATSTATVNLTVNAVNDNPVAISDIVTARQNTAKTILAADLLANDADIEGDALSLTQVQNAQNGTVALDSNGNVVFTANANVTTASFEYTLSDVHGGIDTAVVSVLVGMVDDGGNGQDTMNGTAGDDVLNGGNGDDTLFGFAGDDKLLGGNSIDNLQGGEGKDWLYGGRGNDLLNGGLGRDTFVLISQNGTDTIQDFTDGEDQIGLAEGLTFGQLTVSSSNGNTLIAKNGGDVLAILSGVNSSLITQADFIGVV